MAWAQSLLDASFRGVPFLCLATDDRAERGIVQHEYPYRQGGELDDTGRKARQCEIKAIFYGDSYETELNAFIAALDEGGQGELIHPVFGIFPAMVQDYAVRHDEEQPDRADVSIAFVESGVDNPFFAGNSKRAGASDSADGLDGALESAKTEAGLGLTAWTKDFLATMPGAGDMGAVSAVFQEASAIFRDVEGAATALVSYLDFPLAFVSDMEGAASKAYNLLGTDGDDVTRRFQGWQRLNALYGRVTRDPSGGISASGGYAASAASYGGGSIGGGGSPAAPSVTLPPADTSPAPQPAITPLPTVSPDSPEAAKGGSAGTDTVAYIVIVVINIIITRCMAEHTADTLLAESAAPTLTPAEVETLVGNTRARIRDCVHDARLALPKDRVYPVTRALRDAAAQAQNLGLAIINARPPLITHIIASPCNTHLLAHALYGDYTRAAEIERLNPHIRQPNFLPRGQEVQVYAS